MTEIKPAFLQQSGSTLSANIIEKTSNPYNVVNIATAEEIGEIAQKEIGTMPYKIATAGYSAPPQGYEEATKQFLKMLDGELGTRSTAFVTSPTANKGSIDAITSEITGLNKGKIFYTTVQKDVKYINPNNFPKTLNTVAYSKLPKHTLPNSTEYSKAMAEASNVFVAIGGRNVTVNDFVNAIKKGNKVVVLNNPSIDTPAWGTAKGRVENASKYLSEQLEAFTNGRTLPHPEIGDFTTDFMTKNKSKLNQLVKIITLEGTDTKSILNAAKKAAKFIR